MDDGCGLIGGMSYELLVLVAADDDVLDGEYVVITTLCSMTQWLPVHSGCIGRLGRASTHW
jgi:hypothetical protein